MNSLRLLQMTILHLTATVRARPAGRREELSPLSPGAHDLTSDIAEAAQCKWDAASDALGPGRAVMGQGLPSVVQRHYCFCSLESEPWTCTYLLQCLELPAGAQGLAKAAGVTASTSSTIAEDRSRCPGHTQAHFKLPTGVRPFHLRTNVPGSTLSR